MIHSTCGIQPQFCDVFNQHPDSGILYHTRAGNHCGFSGYYPWPCSELGARRTLLLSPSVQPWDVCLVHLEVSWHGHLQIIQIRSNLQFFFVNPPIFRPQKCRRGTFRMCQKHVYPVAELWQQRATGLLHDRQKGKCWVYHDFTTVILTYFTDPGCNFLFRIRGVDTPKTFDSGEPVCTPTVLQNQGPWAGKHPKTTHFGHFWTVSC